MTPEEERDYQEVIRRTKEKFMAHQNIDRRREMVGKVLVELRRTWSAEPEELEANYNILRLSRYQTTQPNGDLVFDCK
jgi:hypothetical protein